MNSPYKIIRVDKNFIVLANMITTFYVSDDIKENENREDKIFALILTFKDERGFKVLFNTEEEAVKAKERLVEFLKSKEQDIVLYKN